MTGEAQVDDVLGPIHIRLIDGRIIQLVNLEIPDLTPYESGKLSVGAFSLLKQTLSRKYVKIYQSKSPGQTRMNNLGHHRAHLKVKNSDIWVQGMLLEKGLARILPSNINTELAIELKQAEEIARKENLGLWESDEFQLQSPESVISAINAQAIVEGKVRSHSMNNNQIYLHFGLDRRSDFTIGISPQVRRILNQQGIDPLKLAHKTIRVRGFVEEYQGPYIQLAHPAWIDLITEKSH